MKKTLLILCFIGCFFIITGCGNKISEKENVDIIYQVENKTIDLDSYEYIPVEADTPEQLLYIGIDNDNLNSWSLFVVEKNAIGDETFGSKKTTGIPLTLDASQIPLCLFEGEEEVLYVLSVKAGDEDKNEFYLSGYKMDGTQSFSKSIVDVFETINEVKSSVDIIGAVCDKTGRIVAAYKGEKSGYLVFTREGDVIANIRCMGTEPLEIEMVGNDVYTIENVENKTFLFEVDIDEKELSKVIELEGSGRKVKLAAADNAVLWISNSKELMRMDIDTKEVSEWFLWSEAGISGDEISHLFADRKGQICAVLLEQTSLNERKIIFLADEDEMIPKKEKQVITIANLGREDARLLEAIGQFNLQNSDYCVKMMSFEGDSKAFETQLIGGNGPDIIPLFLGADYMQKSGILEDLNPYLEKSNVLNREQLNKKVLELYTIEEALTCIPPTFYINTVMGRASELGKDAGWTTEEFLEYIEVNRGCSIFEGPIVGASKVTLVYNYWFAEKENLVDFQAGQANFDTDGFRAILEYAQNYEAFYDESTSGEIERIREKQYLLYTRPIYEIGNYMYYNAIFENDMVIIGEPSSDGKPKHGMECQWEYGINVHSEQKEGAWAFLEYLITLQEDVVNTRNAWSGFSTYLPAYERQLEYEMKRGEARTESDMYAEVIVPPVTVDDVAKVEELIESISYLDTSYDPTDDIFYEEVNRFLNGEITAEKTIELLNNRIQLYLDEMN